MLSATRTKVSSNPAGGLYASCLIARIHQFNPELPAFERHQHRPKIGPVDPPAIDDHTRQTAVLAAVPFDSSTDRRCGYSEITCMLDQVPDRQSTLDLLHQISE